MNFMILCARQSEAMISKEYKMSTELLRSILVVVIAFLLKLFLAAIGVQIDDVLFNTLVAAIVVWILHLLGLEVAARFAPHLFKAK